MTLQELYDTTEAEIRDVEQQGLKLIGKHEALEKTLELIKGMMNEEGKTKGGRK